MKGFINKFAEIAWNNFEATGKISFYMLYNAVQNPENVNYRMVSEGKDINKNKNINPNI